MGDWLFSLGTVTILGEGKFWIQTSWDSTKKKWPASEYQVTILKAQSAEAVEYTNCITAEEYDPPSNEGPEYEIKQSDGKPPVTLELWEIRSTPSLPSLPDSLWPRAIAPDSVIEVSAN